MNDFIKKNIVIIISICILLGIFLYGYHLSKSNIRKTEQSIYNIKNSCAEYEKSGIFIRDGEEVKETEYVDLLCAVTNKIKINKYNAYSTYLLSIDSVEQVPQTFFFIIPIIIIICSSYSLSFYLKNTNKRDITNDEHSVKLIFNSYKNILLFPIFFVIALIISFIISGHIYYEEAIDIGFNLGFIDVLLYIIYVISVFGIFTNISIIIGRRESNFIINSIVSTLICGIVLFLVGNYLEIEVPLLIEPVVISTRTMILVILTFLVTTHVVYGLYRNKKSLIEAKGIK